MPPRENAVGTFYKYNSVLWSFTGRRSIASVPSAQTLRHWHLKTHFAHWRIIERRYELIRRFGDRYKFIRERGLSSLLCIFCEGRRLILTSKIFSYLLVALFVESPPAPT